MNTSLVSSHNTTRRVASLVSPEAGQLLALGQARHWDCEVLGRAPCPTWPVRVEGWLIAPVQQDSSRIPARTLERVQAIYAVGLRPKAFVLVHEAPMQLAAPARPDSGIKMSPHISPELKLLLKALGGLTLGAAALAATAIMAVPLALVLGLAMVDPILVAITEDDYWIEIDRWNV